VDVVSIGKRILDLAKANLNALLDKAGEETPIDQLSDEELEAELAKRKERKRRLEEEGKRRLDAERKAAERAAQSARARANQATPPPRIHPQPPPRRTTAPPPRQEQRKPPPTLPTLPEKRLRELYAQLETPYGAPFDEVKKSFRKLMRKYHPDLHISNPAK